MMKKLSPVWLALLLVLAGFAPLRAQESPDIRECKRPVASAYMLEAGGVSVLDTYLSPIRYLGPSLALTGKWIKAMAANPAHLRMEFDARISGAISHNPHGNFTCYDAGVAFDWGLNYRWTLPMGLQLSAGGAVGFFGGCLYLPSNGNNPADGRLTAGLSLTASAAYKTRIGRMPFTLSDECRLPSINAFFTHGYGEPYYEIYLGNHSGLVKAGWWGNHFCIDNLLAADLHLGRNILRLGYRFRTESAWANQINTQIVTHAFVVGFVPDFGRRRPNSVNPLYHE